MSVLCKVCGMVLNEKNYDFNKEGMPYENKKEKYKCCPFCGAHEEYFGKGREEIFNMESCNLSLGDKTLLDHAAKLEMFNGDFYTEAFERSQEINNKMMFKALANIEYIHAKVHLRLLGEKKTPEISLIKYDRLKNDDDFVKEANVREQHAVSFYLKSMKNTENPIIKTVMKAFVGIEGDHIQMTEINAI